MVLACAAPDSAQHETGTLALFTERKIARETPEAMVAQAQELRSGASDGLLLPRCLLLGSKTYALMDMAHSIPVPQYEDVVVYHIYVIRKKKIDHHDLFIAISDQDDRDED